MYFPDCINIVFHAEKLNLYMISYIHLIKYFNSLHEKNKQIKILQIKITHYYETYKNSIMLTSNDILPVQEILITKNSVIFCNKICQIMMINLFI